jgi:hypothetical protein
MENLRKAKMKKNTKYNDGKRLSIGDEVMVKKTALTGGRESYRATNVDGKTPSFEVTPSMFEYTDDETFIVFVKRTITSYRNVQVKAKDKKEAERLALELAVNLQFDEPETEHTFHGALTESEHKNMFK